MEKENTYKPQPKIAWTEKVDTPRQIELHKKYVIDKSTTWVQEITIRNYLAQDMTIDRNSFEQKKKSRRCIIL